MEPPVDLTEPTTRGAIRRFLRNGFRLAFGYCCVGITVELLRPVVTEALYHQVATFLYRVPLALLSLTGLAEPLAEASVEGRLPRFIAAAAAPAVGVLAIFVIAFVASGAVFLLRTILSLKQRA